jgi:2-oxoisovalerate dehydrogenase E1 component alpha subunit
MGVEKVSVRAEGYGFEGVTIDGNDVLTCYETMAKAVDKARTGGGPTLIECETYRFFPHTSDDDDRTYRTREEVDEAKKKDPILLFGGYLKEHGILDDAGIETTRTELKAEIDALVEEAWSAADPEPDTVARHVFAEEA